MITNHVKYILQVLGILDINKTYKKTECIDHILKAILTMAYLNTLAYINHVSTTFCKYDTSIQIHVNMTDFDRFCCRMLKSRTRIMLTDDTPISCLFTNTYTVF